MELVDSDYSYNRDFKYRITAQNSLKDAPTNQIFIEIFKYIKKTAMNTLKAINVTTIYSIQWIFTIPSDWNAKAKIELTTWAEDAELINRNIYGHMRFLSEARCSSISCQSVDIDASQAPFKSGERYMLIDAGGGMYHVYMYIF